MPEDKTPRRALVEISPELLERLRDPRTVLGIALVVCGAIAVLVGYWGVSGTLDPGKQLPYVISGGIGGVFLLGAGATLIFSGDLAETRRNVDELRHQVGALQRDVTELLARTEPVEPAEAASDNGTPHRRSGRRPIVAEDA